jgi:hypothetical protein
MQLFNVLLGLIVLVYGRRLFWIFIAIAGFLVGLEFTRGIFENQPYWVLLIDRGCFHSMDKTRAAYSGFRISSCYNIWGNINLLNKCAFKKTRLWFQRGR